MWSAVPHLGSETPEKPACSVTNKVAEHESQEVLNFPMSFSVCHVYRMEACHDLNMELVHAQTHATLRRWRMFGKIHIEQLKATHTPYLHCRFSLKELNYEWTRGKLLPLFWLLLSTLLVFPWNTSQGTLLKWLWTVCDVNMISDENLMKVLEKIAISDMFQSFQWESTLFTKCPTWQVVNM